jgi:hypothetical protein
MLFSHFVVVVVPHWGWLFGACQGFVMCEEVGTKGLISAVFEFVDLDIEIVGRGLDESDVHFHSCFIGDSGILELVGDDFDLPT